MDGEAVDGVASENFQKGWEFVGRMIADAGFHGEATRDSPGGREDIMNLVGVAKKPAARVLSANDGRRAAEVQVYAGDGVFRSLALRTGSGDVRPIDCAKMGRPVSFSRIERRM